MHIPVCFSGTQTGIASSSYSIEDEQQGSRQSGIKYGTGLPSKPTESQRQISQNQIQPFRVHGYFMKKHVFHMKDHPPDPNRSQFAHAKATQAYAKNCLPRTYTMIFVPDKQVFREQIGQEAAIKTKNYSNNFTTDKGFFTMTFKLSTDNDSYLFKEKGLRQLSLACNDKRQIEHLNKAVEPSF
jgi:hypothetical protein